MPRVPATHDPLPIVHHHAAVALRGHHSTSCFPSFAQQAGPACTSSSVVPTGGFVHNTNATWSPRTKQSSVALFHVQKMQTQIVMGVPSRQYSAYIFEGFAGMLYMEAIEVLVVLRGSYAYLVPCSACDGMLCRFDSPHRKFHCAQLKKFKYCKSSLIRTSIIQISG